MDEFGNKILGGGWSWEENKLFEVALAVVDQQDPARWEVVAAMVGGKKSAEDVHKHYLILLEDLHFIESGKLDHQLLAQPLPCVHVQVQVDSPHSPICWTDEDHNWLVQLDIN
uniref:Myb-like domain-containing protein n=1 Tax=Davidia involucrata TaxID=16924 RepID=A0A5B6ZL78_DAVIN